MHHAREFLFDDSDALSDALAWDVGQTLRAAIAAREQASLVVSGGRTPLGLFNRLSAQELAWHNVIVTLADERWVEPDAAASNERLVRLELLRDKAAHAHFIGLKSSAGAAANSEMHVWRTLAHVPRPFDLVLLGMGDDGHTASLFPTAAAIASALDASLPPACIAMEAPVVPHSRLSFNLAALLDARRIVLQIQGAKKWQVYQTAQLAGAATAMPIRAVLRQSRVPVDVYWSP